MGKVYKSYHRDDVVSANVWHLDIALQIYSQYLREYTLTSLVKKYSDYVRYPIRMMEATMSSVNKVGDSFIALKAKP